MSSRVRVLSVGRIVLAFVLVVSALGISALCFAGTINVSGEQARLTMQSMSAMPLAFTENKGQWDDWVLFRANAGGATMWFCKDRIVYQFTRRIPSSSRESEKPGELAAMPGAGASPLGPVGFDPRDRFGRERDSVEQLVVTAKFANANPSVEVIGEGLQEYKCNYFLGNDPAKWRTDVPNYSAVIFKEIYPGIDLRCSGEGTGKAGYEFVAEPGADLGQVRVEYEGVEELSVDVTGRMVARTTWGEMTAVVASPMNGTRPDSPRLAPLAGSVPGFAVAGEVSRMAASLAVTLYYSTYLGGATEEDWGEGIAVDGAGCAYVTGITRSSDFPTQNAFDGSHNNPGYYDAFVTKLSSAGNALVYSTYLGGSNYDQGYGIAVDGSGCAYVTGETGSSDFPMLNAYDASCNSADAFITKLSASGNTLVYSTYLGGTGADAGLGIALDSSGCAYVTGETGSSDFPMMNAYDASYESGDYDVFMTKLSSSGNALVYSTYLGGTGADVGLGIALDSSGCAYVTGYTNSPDFPTQSAYDASYNGGTQPFGTDVFVTKLSSSGNTLVYSTYLGGSRDDGGGGIAVDGYGCAYVTGGTTSSNFPTENAYDASFNGGGDAFITKLSASGNTLVYSTYLGGTGADNGIGVAVVGFGCAYVTGKTSSSDFPAQSAYDASYNGNEDAFVTKLSSSGNTLVYSTYLGGSGSDGGECIALDGFGSAYVTGGTNSSNFPTENAYDASFNGGLWDVFVTKLSDLPDTDRDGVPDAMDNCLSTYNPSQESGLVPFSLTLC